MDRWLDKTKRKLDADPSCFLFRVCSQTTHFLLFLRLFVLFVCSCSCFAFFSISFFYFFRFFFSSSSIFFSFFCSCDLNFPALFFGTYHSRSRYGAIFLIDTY